MRKSTVTGRSASSIVLPLKPRKRTGVEALDRSGIDREHLDLCLTLRLILDSDVTDSSYVAGMKLLSDFHGQLLHHHDTENELLKAHEPRNWQTHIELHAELVAIASDILKKSIQDNYLDATSIEGLLVVLERHIDTLDADLFALCDAGQ